MTEPSLDHLKYILALPQGRKTLWTILGAGGLFQQPFATDPVITAFNCGRLNEALRLWADCLSADPDLTAMMIKEQGNVANSAERADAKRDAASEPKPSARDPDDTSFSAGLGLDRLTGRPASPDSTWLGDSGE